VPPEAQKTNANNQGESTTWALLADAAVLVALIGRLIARSRAALGRYGREINGRALASQAEGRGFETHRPLLRNRAESGMVGRFVRDSPVVWRIRRSPPKSALLTVAVSVR